LTHRVDVEGSVICGESGSFLVGLATTLELEGVELAAEFAEMVQADGALTPAQIAPTSAAAELMVAPTTAAESTAAHVLRDVLAYARDAHLNQQELNELASLAAVYVSRFESYLAECGARERDS
jgi:hypothetical protein